MIADDAGLLATIRAVFEIVDPMPPDLPERIRFSLALRDLDAELARFASAEEELALAARGAEESRTITFDSDSLTIMIRIDGNADGTVRVDGWLAPPQRRPIDIKTTAAPHYRRVVLQRQRARRREGAQLPNDGVPHDAIGRSRGVNDGNGFVFVSHRGEIYPSGFLPSRAGNVRTDDLAHIYRTHPLFTSLRDADRLEGKCGSCEFKWVCGGSRSRAFALTGNVHAADPLCAYMPTAWAALAAGDSATIGGSAA